MPQSPKRPFAYARLVASAAALAWLILFTAPAWAVVEPQHPTEDQQEFPRPPIVRKMVRFWERIFSKYPSTTVIVHEMGDPDRIIDVIDYRSFVRKDDKKGPVPRKEREEVTKRYLKRYEKALRRFAVEGEKATGYGPIEQRVYDVFQSDPAALRRLYAGEIKIRAQTGLADDFISAATTAQAYLPYMEKVFAQYGVPARLTRLPFVESMFNVKARSKVGASGIWQFMPATARNFIFVNSLVDERNSPFKETRAAAQLLLTNYRELGAWPLAITAYNHGKEGMARAVKTLGTRDIATIINEYDAKPFGFASRNFYAEFLAAADTYDRLVRGRKVVKTLELPESEPVIIQRPITVATLLKVTSLTKELLADLNPCLLDAAFTSSLNKPLPAFYEIRVPRAMASAVKAALLNLKDKRYARK